MLVALPNHEQARMCVVEVALMDAPPPTLISDHDKPW